MLVLLTPGLHARNFPSQNSFMLYEFWKKKDIFVLSEDMIHHWTTLLLSHTLFLLQAGKVCIYFCCKLKIQVPNHSIERRRLHSWIFICLFGADPWKDFARMAARAGNTTLSRRLYDVHMALYLFGRVLMWPVLWLYNYFCSPPKIENPLKVTPLCVGKLIPRP